MLSSLPAQSKPCLIISHCVETLLIHAAGSLIQTKAAHLLLPSAPSEVQRQLLSEYIPQLEISYSDTENAWAGLLKRQLQSLDPQAILLPSPLLKKLDVSWLGEIFNLLDHQQYAGELWLFGGQRQAAQEQLVGLKRDTLERKQALLSALQLDADWIQARMREYARGLSGVAGAEAFWVSPAAPFHAVSFSSQLKHSHDQTWQQLLQNSSLEPISVLIRTQNRPRLLQQALASLAAQTYPLLEVVVVNDGGEDVSSVLSEFEYSFSQGLQYLPQKTAQGRSEAANIALRAAKSPWVAFLDDDDTWDVDGLSALARYQNWDKDFIYGQVRVIDMEKDGAQTSIIGEAFNKDRLFLVNSIPICAYICKREQALAVGGFDADFDVLEDWEFLIRLTAKASVHYVPRPVSNYRVWGQAHVTGNNREKEATCRTLLYRKHAKCMTPELLSRASLAFIDKYHADLLGQHQKDYQQKQQALTDLQNKADQRLHENNLEHQQAHAEQGRVLDELRKTHETTVADFRREQDTLRRLHEQAVAQLREHHEQDLTQRIGAAEHHWQQKLAEQRRQLEDLQAKTIHQAQVMTNVHNGWTRRMRQLIWRMAEGLIFVPEPTLNLHKHGLSTPVKAFFNSKEQTELVIPELEGVRAPIPILQGKNIQWPMVLRTENGEATPILLLQLGTYGRLNECHLALQILREDMQGVLHLCAESRLDGRTVKDNQYTSFFLDQPLSTGRYICRLTSPDSDNFQHALCLWLTVHYRHSGGTEMQHYHYREPLPIASAVIESLAHKPLISIVVPVYNPAEHLLRDCIESVIAQQYPNWQLCLADDASTEPHVRPLLAQYQARDPERIKVVFREQNGHIVAASNSALEVAEGEYIALLDHDDLLTADALLEVVKLINAHSDKTVDVIYSDEDKVDEMGEFDAPYFKPDWSPDILRSQMYIGHLGVYRHSLIKKIGGFRPGFEGSQDWDLALRATEKAEHILHIPKVLYHWRIHEQSAASDLNQKPYAVIAGQKAVQEALDREGLGAKAELNEINLCINTYPVPEPAPKVSIVIPTRDMAPILERCLESLVKTNTYPNWEIVVVDNDSEKAETFELFDAFRERLGDDFRVVDAPGAFNFSRLVNQGVAASRGELVLQLNNDTEVIGPENWLELMVGHALRPEIAGVGCKLLYPDGSLQHAGVICGIGGVAGHSHKHFSQQAHGYFSRLSLISNYSALTAACLLVRRELWDEVQGFSEDLAVAFNDVDFCLKLLSRGYRHVLLPQISFYHYESKSRGHEDTPEKQRRFKREVEKMQARWGQRLSHDPYYNPHLSHVHENFSLDQQSPYYGDEEALM